MKIAKAHAIVFELWCPYCEEPISEVGGSHSWLVHEDTPLYVECDSCNEVSTVPRKLPGVALRRVNTTED